MKQFHIDKFTGMNAKDNPVKLPAGEFQLQKGARVNSESIQQVSNHDTLTFPIPTVLASEGLNYAFSVGTGFTQLNPGGITTSEIAVKVTGSLTAGDLVTLFIPTYSNGVTSISCSIFADDAGGSLPGTNISRHGVAFGAEVPIYSSTSPVTTQDVAWTNVSNTVNVDVTNYWISFIATTDILTATSTYVAEGFGSFSSTWAARTAGTGAFSPFTTIFPGKNEPFYKVVGSTTGKPDDAKLVHMPYEQVSLTVDGTTQELAVNDASRYAMNTILLENGDQTLQWKPRLVSDAFSSQKVTYLKETLFVLKDGIIAATAKNSSNCVPIMCQNFEIVGNSLIAPSGEKPWRTLDIEYFNGALVVSGFGVDLYRRNPCYYQLASTQTATGFGYPNTSFTYSTGVATGYDTADTLPEYPRGVFVYNNTIVFYRTPAAPYRVHYSIPGEFAGFTSTDFLNITNGDEIIKAQVTKNRLLFGTHEAIYLLNGVMGFNASLQQIKSTGLLSKDAMINIPGGTAMALSDGIFLYNGSWNFVEDKLGLYTDNVFDSTISGLRSTYGNNLKFTHIPRWKEIAVTLEGHSGILVFNYQNGSTYYLNPDSPEIELMGNYPDLVHPNMLWYQSGVCRGFELDSTSSYGLNLTGGWIDVDPEVDKKQFKTITLQLQEQAEDDSMTVRVTTDEGHQKETVFNFNDYADNNVSRLKFDINMSARLIKIDIFNNSATNVDKITISKITVQYNDGKLRT